MEALINACVLTGDGLRERQTVVTRDGKVQAVMDDSDFDQQGVDVRDIDGQLLLPGSMCWSDVFSLHDLGLVEERLFILERL